MEDRQWDADAAVVVEGALRAPCTQRVTQEPHCRDEICAGDRHQCLLPIHNDGTFIAELFELFIALDVRDTPNDRGHASAAAFVHIVFTVDSARG